MRITMMKLKNFRSYKDEVSIEFGNLTAFVGKNDVGKSTILEALDIFFNDGKGVIKLDKDDINKDALSEENKDILISVCFDELPTSIIIDSTNETTLQNEYLLNINNQLEIIKRYPSAGTPKVFVKANHPTNVQCSDLLKKTNTELRKILTEQEINCEDKSKNSVMRRSIWNHYFSNIQLSEIEIDVTKGETKSIWEKLQDYLPLYSLFQSDRKNSDGDSEVQDPLKEAVKQILNNSELKQKFNEIAIEVETKLQEVSRRTLEKLREMNEDIADSLTPVIPSSDSLKWVDVFKSVSISGDNGIPINKRGSGVKRLVLLNFFRAEAERRKAEKHIPSIIYAIEEPETSQHTDHQKKLIKAFLALAATPNTTIIITTHSAMLVKELKFEHLRLISLTDNIKSIRSVLPSQLPYPSLNEVNHLAFAEITAEYHNELYGFIEAENLLSKYKVSKATMKYNKIQRDGTIKEEQVILTEYIRHQIHHPENNNNSQYSFDQLGESIEAMRVFIQNHLFDTLD